VFGAMFSYIMQALSFIRLRSKMPDMERPYRSPLGVPGAALTVVIAIVTLYFQLSDATYRTGVMWVAIWFAIGIAYFALVGRHRLILSPEEEFAMQMAENKGLNA
jgi:ethanolamine permease